MVDEYHTTGILKNSTLKIINVKPSHSGSYGCCAFDRVIKIRKNKKVYFSIFKGDPECHAIANDTHVEVKCKIEYWGLHFPKENNF